MARPINGLGMRLDRVRILLLVICVLMVLWFAFARAVVPHLIESAYRGQSLHIFNSLITGQSRHPVDHYWELWDWFANGVLLLGVMFCLAAVLTTSRAFFARFVGEATPGTLGAIRMWTCAILLISTLWDDLSSIALLPAEFREPMGFMQVLSLLPIGFDRFVASEAGLRMFQWLTELLLFLGLIGWRTRVVVPLATVSALVLNGILREFSGYWHQNLVPVYVLAVLSFAPCGDGWSIDRLRKIYRGEPVPDAESPSAIYGWARYACWVPIALTYAAAGLSKLRTDGLLWVHPLNMRALLYEQTLYPRAGNFSVSLLLAPAPDIVFVLLGIAAISSEALFITVLFSRTARRILPAVTIFMHIGIIFLMNIVFLDLIMLQLIFYDFTGVRQAIARRLNRGGPIRVLYDGSCGLCLRTVRLLASADLFRRLEFLDFRRLDLTGFNRQHGVSLTAEALEQEMFVIAGGRRYGGFAGYRLIARAVPLFWPLVPLLYLPGVSRLGNIVYGYVARTRLRLVRCDAECSPALAGGERAVLAPPATTQRRNFGYGVAVAALIAVLGICWLYRIEYYPFTAVQMFGNYGRPVVTYFKAFGHHESGAVSPVYLEDTLDFLSINSRYERLFDLCFARGSKAEVCQRSLAILGAAYNRRMPPGNRLTHLEIQRWKWDFVANPRDPNYGHVEARAIAEIPDPRKGPVNGSQGTAGK